MTEQLKHNPYKMLQWKIICCEERIDVILNNINAQYPNDALKIEARKIKEYEDELIIVAEEYPECLV